MSEPPKIVPIKTLPKLPPLETVGKAKRLEINNPSQGPTAMSASFSCQSCKGTTEVLIPWNATPLERTTMMKEALDLHRKLCPVGFPEDMRVYDIFYPR